MDKKFRVGGHIINVSNADKLLFPGNGILKEDLVEYYHRIAPVMLPFLKDRPLTMHRFPDGISKEGFYQQETPEYFPNWLERVRLAKQNGSVNHVLCNNSASLVFLAAQSCITPHVWLSRTDRIEHPDMMVFDLDPPGDDFSQVRDAALLLRELLQHLGLKAYLKATGSKGVHIAVPLNRRSTFDEVRVFARDAATWLAKEHGDKLTVEQRKNKRGNRVYLDTLRNSYGQTAVTPYALRAKPGAPVAALLDWEELKDSNLSASSYNISNIFNRIENIADPWRDFWHSVCSIMQARDNLNNLREKGGAG